MISFITYLPLFAQGIKITLAAWITAASISLMIGTLLGFLSCDYVALPTLKYLIRFYTFVTKGVPAYVQILIMYFVIPHMLHISLSGFEAATCALGICSSGYVTEIVRAGINGIARGQWDACFVLGYPLAQTIRRIIAPQVARNIMPTLLGELEQLLKSTTLLATIGVTEITRVGMNIISRELNPFTIYGIIACIYLLCAAVLQLLMLSYEKGRRYDNH